MKKMKLSNSYFLCFVLVTLSITNIFSQYKNGKYTFESLNKDASQRAILSIAQDHKGLIWMGTNGVGLIKYDGVNFTSYRKIASDSTSLNNSLVYTLFIDSSKQLWIGTESGLNLYDRDHDRFIEITLNPIISKQKSQSVYSIIEHENGKLLIGTGDYGLIVLDPNTLVPQKVKTQNTLSLTDFVINCIVDDGHGHMLVGTNQGLYRYLDEDNMLVPMQFETAIGTQTVPNQIQSLLIDKQKHLWIGTYSDGLIHIKLNENEPYQILNYNLFDKRVLSLVLGPDENILCGTENEGLFVLDENGQLLETYRYDKSNSNSIKSNSIWSLFVDRQKRIWIGYYNQGVGVYDKFYDKFYDIKAIPNLKNSLQSSSVTGITQTAAGKFLIAMDGGGIDVYDPVKEKYTHLIDPKNTIAKGLESSDAQTVFIDSKENIWVGTWNSGIYFLPKNGGTFINYNTENTNGGLTSNSIASIAEDSLGTIWIGTFYLGLHTYDPQKKLFAQFTSEPFLEYSMQIRNIRRVLIDSEDNVWLGTTKGLFKINAGKTQNREIQSLNVISENSESGNTTEIISSLYESKNKSIWIGTVGSGLCHYNAQEGSFKWYNKGNGLAQETIAGIIEDQDGNIWVSGEAGISKLDTGSEEIMNFDRNDGLLANDFNYNATFKDNSGMLYFGSYEGINYFDPATITFNNRAPDLLFTDFKLFNKSVKTQDKNSPLTKVISETTELTLNHKQSVFTIEFAGINYTRGQNNQYAYYLEGFEKNWNYVGNSRSATYTNLSPGKYNFKVKAANNDEVWNDSPLTLGITVLSPWWATNLAIFAYSLLFFLIVIFINRYVNQRLKEKRLLALERGQRRHEELLNENKIQFFTNISHEFRTPLTLILNPIKDIIDNNKYQIDDKVKAKHNTILKNANRLKTLMDELMDFRKLQMNKMPINAHELNAFDFIEKVASYFNEEAAEKNILFAVEGDGTEPLVWWDSGMLEKVIFNLLSNAFKATPENGAITIGVYNSKKPKSFPLINKEHPIPAMEIVVEDTGTGIKKEDLPHIFKRFYQSKDKKPEYYGGSGTGIGLEVAQGFINLHRGKIKVESVERKGTKFTITLPLGKEHLNFPKTNTLEMSENNSAISKSSESDTYPSINNPSTSKKETILIVEDNSELRKYLRDELSGDYAILEVENGLKGLQLALKSIPDIIITDIIMPEMDGFEFCKALKSNISTSHIPIIMLTAKTMSDDRIKGINAGADAYLTKPFEMKVLYSYLNRLIENRQIFINKDLSDPNRLNLLENTTDLDKSFMQKVLDYLNKNIGKSDLNVEYLADDMHLSRSQLYRKIKAMTGFTPNELIRKIRMVKAKKMIVNGSESVGEVGFKVGFSSPSYFSRCFKSEFGILPTELKSNRLKDDYNP